MNIAGHEIGREPFTIAEAGLNHCGDLGRALEMVSIAKNAGCTAIKFQTFKAADVCDAEQDYTYREYRNGALYQLTEKRINIFRRCELPESAWPVLKAECDRVGIVFLSTPETPADLDILLKVGIPAIKIGSDNLTNLPMLRYCSRDDVALPILLSCGMSDLQDVCRALRSVAGSVDTTFGRAVDTAMLNSERAALMVCTSEYPCPSESANLTRITTLRGMFPRHKIGLSDHTEGALAAGMAVALGASVFESHFTLRHELPGPDHRWAKTPVELAYWVDTIKRAHVMLGDGVVRPSAAELEVKAKFQRNVPE